MKECNSCYLLILVVSVAAIISASFANNYFAYHFWAKTKDHSVNKDNIIKAISKPSQPELDLSWKWSYSEISAKEHNYPVVVLRDGYKAIIMKDNKVQAGWKYELLNTSPIHGYNVSISYKLNDKDGFKISESSASEIVPAEQIRTIQSTTWIPYEDFIRISRSSWSVHLNPDWKEKKLKGNRFERAGRILKENIPYWFKGRLQYLFLDDFPSGKDEKGFSSVISPNKWTIAQIVGIKPDLTLITVGEKLSIDLTAYNLPSWKSIISNPNYASLTKEEKQSLKTFLRIQKEHGDYSPESGRTSSLVWKDDFPDPQETLKK